MFNNMLSDLSKLKLGSGEGSALQNFRRLHGEGGNPYEAMTVTSDLPIASYVMTSLFNQNFAKPAPLEHMVREGDRVFGLVKDGRNAIVPQLFINSRELQEVTAETMFGAGAKKKLDGAEYNFIARFQEAERAIEKDNKNPPRRHLLPFRDITKHQQFGPCYQFFSSIILSQASTLSDNLQTAFAGKDTRALSAAIINAGLPEKIEAVVNTFVSHNRNIAKQPGDIEDAAISKEALKSLCTYLATEYAAFLTLAFLDTLQAMQEAFADANVVLAISLTANHPVQPVMAYPISASKDGLAEKSFGLFLELQDLYAQYCEGLGLLPFARPLWIADSLITNKKPSKVAAPPHFLSSPTAGSSSAPTAASSPLAGSSPIAGSQLLSAASSTMFRSTSADVTARKIIQALEAEIYKDTGVDEFVLHRNGVVCTVKFLQTNKNGQISNEENVLKMISKAVDDIIKTNEPDYQVLPKIHYNGHYYQLRIQLNPDNFPTSVVKQEGP